MIGLEDDVRMVCVSVYVAGGGGVVISPYIINKLSPRKTMMEI